MIYQPEEPYFAMKKGTRVFDLIFHQYKNYPQEVCLSHKVGNQWKSYSTKQMIGVSSRIALGMLASGVKKGDKIGLISESRPEWNFVDLACQLIGAVSVPMYPSLGSKDYLYIFKQAELDMLFVSSKDIYTRVKPLKKAFPNLAIFSFDKLPQVAYWKQIHDLGVKEDFKSLKS
ncbi:MAG: long-chain acyl-CoA synthetase, partial [Cyclobacteriaceae bacterium]